MKTNKLPNGFIEMRRKAFEHIGDAHLELVMGFKNRDLGSYSTTEYVVWVYNKQAEGYGQGFYSFKESEAFENYQKRGRAVIYE